LVWQPAQFGPGLVDLGDLGDSVAYGPSMEFPKAAPMCVSRLIHHHPSQVRRRVLDGRPSRCRCDEGGLHSVLGQLK
jgi:hypothetical protein